MTETLAERRVSAVGTDPLRPAAADRTPAVLPRRLIGVREEILDWVPEERPKYTRLGLILVNTGLMAALSLFVALERVLNAPWIAILPVALFWGALVVTIDSWMISSTHGALGGGRLFIFIPRLVMAVLIGTAIAEPLVLWIFHPAIHANVLQARQQADAQLASEWQKCNPPDGSPVNLPECADHHLPIKSPQEIQDELTKTTQERDGVQGTVATLRGELADKQAVAQAECAGTKTTTTSGQVGNGKRCAQDWKVADDFEKQIDLPGKQTALDGLDAKVTQLTTDLADAKKDYGQQVEKAIQDKVEAQQASYRKPDIIDEARGLERLSDQSIFVRVAHWLVLALLILIDSLPVLAKMISGVTYYDVQVHKQVQTGGREHERWLGVRGYYLRAEAEVETSQIDHDRDARIQEIETRMQEVEDRRRTAQARHEEDLDAEIDRLAAYYAKSEGSDGAASA